MVAGANVHIAAVTQVWLQLSIMLVVYKYSLLSHSMKHPVNSAKNNTILCLLGLFHKRARLKMVDGDDDDDMTILMCTQKLTDASLIYRTEPETKKTNIKELKLQVL